MRFAAIAPFCLLSLAPAACSSSSGFSVADTTPPLVLASCHATFEVVETDPPEGGTMTLVTAGDTLLYTPDSLTLLAYVPGTTEPTTLVSSSDTIGYFWVDGSVVMWTTDRSFWQVPLTGGAPTAFLTPAIDPDVMPAGRILTHDADAIYGATVLDSVAAASNDPTITVFRQPFRCPVRGSGPCGQVQTLATLSVSPEALFSQLFDAGDSVLLEDSGGEVFSIPKDGRPATRVASNLNARTALLFAPHGPSAFYGSLQDTEGLVSLALADGSQTPLWPSTQPTFAATSLALDASGAAFVAGTAFISGASASSPPQSCPAYGWVPPGGSGALLGCGAYCGALSDTAIVNLVAGDTVLYAKTFSAGVWGVVRLPKQV